MMSRVGVATTEDLNDGESVVVRPLYPTDDAAVVAALSCADPSDLRRRFLGNAPPASTLLRYLHHADAARDLVLGAFTDAGQLIGVAQFDMCRGEVDTAELAIVIDHDFQHRGLGRLMMRRLELDAQACGIHHLVASYYRDNVPILRLLAGTGHLHRQTGDGPIGSCVLELSDTDPALSKIADQNVATTPQSAGRRSPVR